MLRRIATYSIAAIAIAISGMSRAGDVQADASFTVSDAIALNSVISQDGHRIQVSPDGRLVFFVKANGDLKKNVRIFTLEVHEAQKLILPPSADHPADSLVAAFVRETAGNSDAISSARWVDNGRAIAFLGAEDDGSLRPYRFDLASKTAVPLASKFSGKIAAFDVVNNTCVVLATFPTVAPKRDSGWSLRDESLTEVLGLESADAESTYALYAVKGDVIRRLTKPVPYPFASISRIAISPDERYVAAPLPPIAVPASWESYGLPPYDESLRSSRAQRAVQFHLVGIDKDFARPLLDAPIGYFSGERTIAQAKWFANGRSVMLIGTMLPLNQAVSKNRAAIAVVDVSQKDVAEPKEIFSFENMAAGELISTAELSGNVATLQSQAYANPISSAAGTAGKAWITTLFMDGNEIRVDRVSVAAADSVPVISGSVRIRESANEPPELVVSGEDGTSHRAVPLSPWLKAEKLSKITEVSWLDNDGHKWSGGIVVPAAHQGGKKPPLVIQLKFHDPARFSPDGPYTTSFATQALAAKGIVVIELNSFDEKTSGTEQEGPTQMRAVDSAVAFASKMYGIDEERVGLIGFSRTAYHTIYTLVNSKRRYAAASIADGVDAGYMQYQLFSQFSGDALGREFQDMNGGAPFGPGLQSWIKRSPIFNLERVNTPVRIEMIGMSSVLLEWELYASLRRLGKPVEAVLIPDGEHVLVRPRERYISQQGSVDWMDYWLNGSRSKQPVEIDQYERWDALRKPPSQKNSFHN